MEQISKLESRIAEWYDKLPHLPKTWRVWLADNSWWIVLIGVVATILMLLALLQLALLGGLALTVAFGAYGAVLSGFLVLVTLVWSALVIIDLVLMVLAVRPLRAKQKRGWTYLFIMALISVAVAVVRVLWNGQLPEMVSGLMSVAIGGYILFEIREYFTPTETTARVTRKATTSPKIKTPADK
jgi:hypothetical protein